jgi:hypothetical protein
VDRSGAVMIAERPLARPKHGLASVIGVQAAGRFVPLPPGVQRYLAKSQPGW